MASRAGSNRIADLESASRLDEKDEFLFFQNSTKKTKKITRKEMLTSPGVSTTLGIDKDTTAPSTPLGITVVTASEKDRDGTEKVYIRASISANAESDLDSYVWSIRRASGVPTFNGSVNGSGALTGYVVSAIDSTPVAQIFGPTVNASKVNDANATKMSWEVRANTWYEVKVCAVDKSANISAFTALNNTNNNGSGNPTGTVILSAKDTNPPNAPTAVSINSAVRSVFLNWTNPTDSDLSYINIYRNNANTPPTIGTTTPYAKIMSNSYVDSNTTQGTTYYYWLTSVDDSGNESTSTSTVVSIAPGLVAATDITNFAVDATKMFTNTVILKNSPSPNWTDNSPSSGYISWDAHKLVYKGVEYSISAGSTNLTYVYWISPNTSYTVSNTNPSASTLSDDGFVIATNTSGVHDLAWNALANAVIGTAYIQNAAITNAKISDLKADKITSGEVNAQTITLLGSAVIKSSDVTSIDSGQGLWISGTGASGSSGAEFGIGDLRTTGNQYGYMKWKTSTNTLSIKGAITATSLTLSGFTLTPSDVNLSNVQNLSPANQAIQGIQNGGNAISIASGGIEMTTGGFVRGAINWSSDKFTQNSSGYFLGYTTGTPTGYKFFIGETGSSGLGGTNYLYWDGANLKIGGNIIGGTYVGSTSDASGGLIINSPIGIRTANSNQTLTITGGTANGNTNGAQIDFSGNNLGDGNRGVLVLQGGAVGNSLDNGRIDFRTNTSVTTNVGVLRASIRTNGEFIVYKNASFDGSNNVYTTGAGCGQFNGNLSVGMNFDTINSGGNTTGKLWVATEIAVYNGATRNIVLTGSSGDVTAVQFTTSSSKKLKTKIKKLHLGIDTVNELNPVSYNRKGAKNKNEIGLIAEEVNEIIPEIVKKDASNNPEGIDYSKLTVVLINAVKDLSAKVNELEAKLNANRNKV